MIYVEGFTDASFREYTEEGSSYTKSRAAFVLSNSYGERVFKYNLNGIDSSVEAEISAIKLALKDIRKLYTEFDEELRITIFCDCLPAIASCKKRYKPLLKNVTLSYVPGDKNPAHQHCRLR